MFQTKIIMKVMFQTISNLQFIEITQNSENVTFPWLFPVFLNFPDWNQIPWPRKIVIFQTFFPDHGNHVKSWCYAQFFP